MRLTLFATLKAACVIYVWCFSLSAYGVPLEEYLYKGKAVPFYGETPDAEQQKLLGALRGMQLAERMATVVNSTLRIKTDLGVGFARCGRINAFFDPQRRSVVICYEFIDMVGQTARQDTDFLMKLPREQFAKIINGLLWSVYFHELGHAVIHINNVPVTGREEDVADQFAVWFAVNFVNLNETPIIMPSIWFWNRLALERNIPTMSEDERRHFLSNEHSLDEQRVYNMACWVLGTGSEGGAKTAAYAKLPEERAKRCFGEYAGLDAAMKRGFKKYFKATPLRGRW
jgi:hypothetical protein